jgi:RNA polymerase sigma-70 factor (sigma-E family)
MRRDQREQEFSEFFSARGPALRRTAYLVVRDWHTAEDVTHQALAKVYAAWSRIRPETRMAYARRAVVNESLSLLRRHRPETPTQHLPEGPVDDHAAAPDLGRLLDLLPPRQRAIVALRFLDDLPVSEVARLLGVADGTVYSHTDRALQPIRTHLDALSTTQ